MATITVNIATQKARRKSLKKTLAALLRCNTKAEINIYLNDYKAPAWLKKLPVHYVEAPEGDLKAAAKFYFTQFQSSGVYITLDDDFIVNPGYVGYLNEAAYRYAGSVVGFHGIRTFKRPIKSFYHNSLKFYCTQGLANDIAVDSLGTGCISFLIGSMPDISHTTFEGFESATDARFYEFSHYYQIQTVCLTRADGFMKEITDESDVSLWRKAAKNDSAATEIVNTSETKIPKLNRINYFPSDSNMEWVHLREIMAYTGIVNCIEFGSGKSTEVLSKLFDLTSFEENKDFVKDTIRYKPIKDGWYSLDEFDIANIRNAEIIVVDGPKAKTGRYNMPDEIIKQFGKDSIIFVDDCHREKDLELARRIEKITKKKLTLIPGKVKSMAKIE